MKIFLLNVTIHSGLYSFPTSKRLFSGDPLLPIPGSSWVPSAHRASVNICERNPGLFPFIQSYAQKERNSIGATAELGNLLQCLSSEGRASRRLNQCSCAPSIASSRVLSSEGLRVLIGSHPSGPKFWLYHLQSFMTLNTFLNFLIWKRDIIMIIMFYGWSEIIHVLDQNSAWHIVVT